MELDPARPSRPSGSFPAVPPRGTTMDLDPTRFPRAHQYLKSLPAGLDSFPECQINVHVLDHVAMDHPQLAMATMSPKEIRDVLAGHKGEWVTEATAGVVYMMVRDLCPLDKDFLAWNFKNIARLFDRPLYRAMMRVLSTSLVVMGSTKRWSTFHRGTTMTAETVITLEARRVARATLDFPEGLFNDLMLLQHCSTLEAALVASHATEPRAEYRRVGTGKAEFTASWAA